MSIYSGPSYQMGAAQIGGQLGNDKISPKEKATAHREISRMRGSLKRWLKYRTLIGTPAGDVLPVEQKMGQRLYALLGEMFDAQTLPPPTDVIALARIAVDGKLTSDAKRPDPQGLGMIWLWPAVAVVGLVLLTVVAKIRSDADDAADAREKECIMAGKCTDSGFWIKIGVASAIGWVVWEKFLKKRV